MYFFFFLKFVIKQEQKRLIYMSADLEMTAKTTRKQKIRSNQNQTNRPVKRKHHQKTPQQQHTAKSKTSWCNHQNVTGHKQRRRNYIQKKNEKL